MASAPRSPKSAQAAEALDVAAPRPFTFDGATYHAFPTDEWTFDALEAYEEGHLARFVREIMPPADYAAFRATKPKVGQIRDFVTALMGGLGVEGNL